MLQKLFNGIMRLSIYYYVKINYNIFVIKKCLQVNTIYSKKKIHIFQ